MRRRLTAVLAVLAAVVIAILTVAPSAAAGTSDSRDGGAAPRFYSYDGHRPVSQHGACVIESQAILRGIRRDGVISQQGVQGPSIPEVFENDARNGGALLPRFDSDGNPITYREWGTVPGSGNLKPGGERIVTGSDGS